ncbi:hypothetical protein [Streptomyces sp. C3-3]|uniref:hypothetical protein n=1 Tax=Streptomyces sp. C3-3 TaxID=2824901 RepID=UPI001B387658|nr:hypothetical protein [Streptomyces sp. C3-3]MBQ1118346.1 hypothetical protein [Streptomyces sp. C3-3]
MTDTPMTPDRLAEIRNRKLDEVTAGPWLVAGGSDGRPVVYVETLRDGRAGARVLLAADGATEADVQFVASARRSVPELLAEVDRLRARVAELEAAESRLTAVEMLAEEARDKCNHSVGTDLLLDALGMES